MDRRRPERTKAVWRKMGVLEIAVSIFSIFEFSEVSRMRGGIMIFYLSRLSALPLEREGKDK